jgi:hypothetical protein
MRSADALVRQAAARYTPYTLGWIICKDIIHNTQCKVALKRFTATSSSNYVEHIETLRFKLNYVDGPKF